MESHPRREQKHSASSSNLKTRCIFAFFPIASMCVYEFATSSAGWATSPISLFAFFLLLAVTAWQLLSLRVSKFFSAVGSLPVWLIVCGCMFVCACVHLTSLGSFPSVCMCVCVVIMYVRDMAVCVWCCVPSRVSWLLLSRRLVAYYRSVYICPCPCYLSLEKARVYCCVCVFVPGNLSLAGWLISASVLAHSSGYLSLAGWFMIACVFAPAPATYPLKAGLLCVYLPLPLSSCLLRLDYYCVVFCVYVFALLLVPCRQAYCCVCLFAPAPATSSLQAGLLLCVCVFAPAPV